MALVLLLLVSGILLSMPSVQTKIAHYLTATINKDFGTNISIEKVAITVFGSIKLKNVTAKDKNYKNIFEIKRLQTSILDFNKLYNEGHPYLGDLTIDGLHLNMIQEKGETSTNLDAFIDAFDDGTPGSGKFRMVIKSMELKNSKFSYHDYNLENPKIVEFTSLNGKVSNFAIKGSDVTTKIQSLTFTDHRGIKVNEFASDFTYTKKNILLDNLKLKTENSQVNGNVALRYKIEDFKDFNNKVVFEVQFDKASISSNDMNYFYNEFGKNNMFYVDTYLKGTLNNFTTKNLTFTDKFGTEVIGTASYKNLFSKTPNSYQILGDFDRINSNYQSLKNMMPRVLGDRLPNKLAVLGTFDLNGSMDLTYEEITVDVTLISKLGYVKSDLYINKLYDIDKASYNGNIQLDQFDLGTLIGDASFGTATLNLDVNGKGFSKKYLDTNIDGTISEFYFNEYVYHDIDVDGEVKMPFFKGYFNSNDKNLKMDFDGLVDLSSKSRKYDFSATIDYANLKALKLFINDSISIVKGNIKIDAIGNSFDEIYGDLTLKNLYYQNHKKEYFFEDFNLQSSFDINKERTIKVNSTDIIDGKVVGKYRFNQVIKLVENAVGSLYANYAPNKLQPNQYMNFDFNIYNKVVSALLPDIEIAENTRVKGKIIADEELFTLDVKSPFLKINANKISGITLDIDNKNPLYNTYIELDSISTKFYNVSEFNLINVTQNDTLFFRTEFKGGKKQEDKYDLNLFHTINEDKNSVVGFKKSEVFFKDNLWFINENENFKNKVVFDKFLKNFDIEELSFSNNDESFAFKGQIKGDNYKDLQLNFNDLDLNKVTPALNNLTFDGKINGLIDYKQDGEIYKPISDLKVADLKINKFALGDLNVKVSSDEFFRKFNVNTNIVKDGVENFYTKGIIEFVNKKPILSLDTKFENFDIQALGPLLSSVFSDMRGNATGRANIVGNASNPEIDGVIYLEDAGMKVPYLNVDYDLEDRARIDLTENQFFFRNFQIEDTKYKTKGIVSGTIKHKNLDKWVLDVKIESDNILGLDTPPSEDSYYYGTAFMDGYATIKGPVEALSINVKGESKNGTVIKIPVKETDDYGAVSYINLIDENAPINEVQQDVTTNGIKLALDFDIKQNAEIEVILNKETGHAMKGKGEGILFMDINTNGTFQMFGDYTIYEGEYNFKYGGIISKKFNVEKLGTIVWRGDPLKAELDLRAIYTAQTNPSVLLESSSISNRKVETQVIIDITGDLENPNTEFSLDYPNVGSVYKSEIQYKLSDRDTKQRQALSVLATGSYIAAGGAASDYYATTLSETAQSLLDGIISSEDDKVKFNLSYNSGSRANEISDQLGFNISSQINEKLSINGKVGVPVGGLSQSGIVGNVELQYQLNKDNSLRARAFNKENEISYIGIGTGYTQGIGLSYNVDFDNFNELWRKIFTPNQIEKDKNNDPYKENIPPDSELNPEYIYLNSNDRKKKEESKKTESKKPIEVPEVE